MSKAAVEGQSVSEIVRGSITAYLRGERGDVGRSTKLWKRATAFAGAGMAVLFAYSVSSSATADYSREFEAMRAHRTSDCTDIAERKRLAKEFAKEFASMRVLIPAPVPPDARRLAFSRLDWDCDGRLALTEYRHLMGIPEGDPGRKLFQSQDHDRDGWLSKEEFSL